MTMIIDKNSTNYKNYVMIKQVFNSFSEKDWEIIKREYNSTIINTLGTVQGIDEQIDKLDTIHGIVYYIDLKQPTRGGDPEVFVNRTTITVKEVEDD